MNYEKQNKKQFRVSSDMNEPYLISKKFPQN